MPRHILIAGPTASGKSALAAALARRLGGVVVNADALQVYRDWAVLTARPGADDLARARHALYGHVAWTARYSVGDWLREVATLLSSGERLVITGGTGLYFTALTRGLARIPPVPDAIRQEADALRKSEGPPGFYAYLARHDPSLFARIDTRNAMRLQRAWEVHRATGKPLSAWQAETPPPMLPLPQTTALVMTSDRDWLAARIERRFDQMLQQGALAEVQAVSDRWDSNLPAAKALGAAELISHLRGEIPLTLAKERANSATRQFAKRQRTWFRSNMPDWGKLPAETWEDSAEDLLSSMT